MKRFATFTFGKVAIGALAGGLSGGIATGSWKGALIGAFSGAAFAAVGNLAATKINAGIKGWATGGIKKVLAHGLVGGASSKLRGGNFLKGFVSAALTQRVAPVLNNIAKVSTTIAAVGAGAVGGAASAITGGKFKDEFWTGLGSYAFNDLNHRGLRGFGGKDHWKKLSNPLSVSRGPPPGIEPDQAAVWNDLKNIGIWGQKFGSNVV